MTVTVRRTDGCLGPGCQFAKACATWPNGEWGYSTRRCVLEPVRPEAVLPDRALCLLTFSHFFIVHKKFSPSISSSGFRLRWAALEKKFRRHGHGSWSLEGCKGARIC